MTKSSLTYNERMQFSLSLVACILGMCLTLIMRTGLSSKIELGAPLLISAVTLLLMAGIFRSRSKKSQYSQ